MALSRCCWAKCWGNSTRRRGLYHRGSQRGMAVPVGGVLSDSGSLGATEHGPKKLVHTTLQRLPLHQRLPVFIRNIPNHTETTEPHHEHVALSCKQNLFWFPCCLNAKAKPLEGVPKSERRSGDSVHGNVQCSDRESPWLYNHPLPWGFYLLPKVIHPCSPASAGTTAGSQVFS